MTLIFLQTSKAENNKRYKHF